MTIIHFEISGFPGEKPKAFQPWEMEGSIQKVTNIDGEHGVIEYINIDTSVGQSGSMICLIDSV